jgi:4-hydroxy-3-polyprenylbenzoate decarboxylase
MTKRIVVAVTGASGALYALRLLETLLSAECEIHLTLSPSGASVLKQELQWTVSLSHFDAAALFPTSDVVREQAASRLHYHHHQDFMSPIASGSFLTDGMVICPCSGGTLGTVASGAASNLIHRAAEVHLKERRRLVLVTRETPLSLVQIENMRAVTLAGGIVLPASPGFYHGAATLSDLVDFVVARICDVLAVPHDLSRRWGT